jgi:hypothetical protein
MEEVGQLDNRKKEVVEALQQCYGIVTDACRKANVPRSTFYHWLNEDIEFKAAVEDTQEQAIDFVEGKLFEKINGITIGKYQEGEIITYEQPPSDTAIIFYLKTKAKKRGYIERSEITGADGESIVLNFRNAGNIPMETKEQKPNGLLTKAGYV